MNPNLTEGDPATEPELNPDVRKAIDNARLKIRNRAHMQAAALKGDLSLILEDFCTTHGITAIDWVPPNDSVQPAFALDLLCSRLGERLAEDEFARFLENFTAGLIDLDAADRRRSQ